MAHEEFDDDSPRIRRLNDAISHLPS